MIEGKMIRFTILMPESDFIDWDIEWCKLVKNTPTVSKLAIFYRCQSSLAIL